MPAIRIAVLSLLLVSPPSTQAADGDIARGRVPVEPAPAVGSFRYSLIHTPGVVMTDSEPSESIVDAGFRESVLDEAFPMTKRLMLTASTQIVATPRPRAIPLHFDAPPIRAAATVWR